MGCCPVFAVTVGALDGLVLRVHLGGGLAYAGFMVPGADIAPG